MDLNQAEFKINRGSNQFSEADILISARNKDSPTALFDKEKSLFQPLHQDHILTYDNSSNNSLRQKNNESKEKNQTNTLTNSEFKVPNFHHLTKYGVIRKSGDGMQDEISSTTCYRSDEEKFDNSPGNLALKNKINGPTKRPFGRAHRFNRQKSLPSNLQDFKNEKEIDNIKSKDENSIESTLRIKNQSFSSSEDYFSPQSQKKSLLQRLGGSKKKYAMTFDAFVDQIKGLNRAEFETKYPSYKLDKRLAFIGSKLRYPRFVFPYRGKFRKAWNLFIVGLILYEAVWYPFAACFLFGSVYPPGVLIFEYLKIIIFLLDMCVNARTTYSNENNEEIVDAKMIMRHYTSSKWFWLDLIAWIPIADLIMLFISDPITKYNVYSIIKLPKLIRLFKVGNYLEFVKFGFVGKILRIFISFELLVHWVACLWYVMIRAQYDENGDYEHYWYPPTLKALYSDPNQLLSYYTTMDVFDKYSFTTVSVFMLMVGGDMSPVNPLQSHISILIGLWGAIILAYVFGCITVIINSLNAQSSLYHQQLEELEQKLNINHIPHNLKVKVMEYFYYTWRKNKILSKTNDFSELSLPLQRDLAFYQHQELIKGVPLFKELEPIEILSIIQKLKTCVYMPGDKIIREGERGIEMFFIQEGVCEVIAKRIIKGPQNQQIVKLEKIFLEKGGYFGEVALLSNSRRTTDVNAFDFCILLSFSKADYKSLKKEFPDIGPRLKGGLKHFKITHLSKLVVILETMDIFENFTRDELKILIEKYLDEVFVDPDTVLLKPKPVVNSLYIILNGIVNCYADNEAAHQFIKNLQINKNTDDSTSFSDSEDEFEIKCLDDDVLNFEKDKETMDSQKRKLDLIRQINYGEYFGGVQIDDRCARSDDFYISDCGCQIGVITQTLVEKMKSDDPVLYGKFKSSMLKRTSPLVSMNAIQEVNESIISGTLKAEPLFDRNPSLRIQQTRSQGAGSELYLSRKPSITSKTGGKFADEFTVIKDHLNRVENEINQFKILMADIASRLKGVPFNRRSSFSPLKIPNKKKGQGQEDKRLESLKSGTYDSASEKPKKSKKSYSKKYLDESLSPGKFNSITSLQEGQLTIPKEGAEKKKRSNKRRHSRKKKTNQSIQDLPRLEDLLEVFSPNDSMRAKQNVSLKEITEAPSNEYVVTQKEDSKGTENYFGELSH